MADHVNNPRVLIFCPTYRLEPETVGAIFCQTYAGPMDILFTRDNPTGNDKADHLHNYIKGRKAFLDGGYDYLWIVESDIIPPTDALEKLIAIGSDVASGAYVFRRGKPVFSVFRYIKGHTCPDETLDNFPSLRASSWGKVVKCSGAGIGCMLINRQTVERVPFRVDPENCHCDWVFVHDLLKAGVNYRAHLGVICGHKQPDGVILWPTREGVERTKGTFSQWHMKAAYQTSDPVSTGPYGHLLKEVQQ